MCMRVHKHRVGTPKSRCSTFPALQEDALYSLSQFWPPHPPTPPPPASPGGNCSSAFQHFVDWVLARLCAQWQSWLGGGEWGELWSVWFGSDQSEHHVPLTREIGSGVGTREQGWNRHVVVAGPPSRYGAGGRRLSTWDCRSPEMVSRTEGKAEKWREPGEAVWARRSSCIHVSQ